MKVPIAQLDSYVTETLLKLKKGVLDARPQLVADLPEKVDFEVEVVFVMNGISRPQISSPSGDRISVTEEGEEVQTSKSTTGIKTSEVQEPEVTETSEVAPGTISQTETVNRGDEDATVKMTYKNESGNTITS